MTLEEWQAENAEAWAAAMDRRAKALNLRNQGLKYREIGDVFGVSAQAAWVMVQRANADQTGCIPFTYADYA